MAETRDSDQFTCYLKTYSQNKKHPFKIIFSFYRGSGFDVLKSALALIAKQSPIWILPIITANIIDIATTPQDHSSYEILWNLAAAALFLLQNIFSAYLYARVYCRVIRRIEMTLRSTLIRKLQQLSILFHKEIQSGKLQSKIMRDVENVELLLNQSFSSLIYIFLDISIAVCVTASRSPIVFLFFLCAVPVAVITITLFRRPIQRRNREFRTQMEETQAAVAEMISLIPVTRAHGLQKVEIQKMNEKLEQVMHKGYRLDTINMIFGATSWVVFQLFQILCLGFTGFLAFEGKISVGEVVLYQSYFTQIVNQVSNLINLYPTMTKGMESVTSIGEILSAEDIEHNAAILPLPNMTGEVEFCNVDYRYQKGEKLILNDFSLKVKAGESVAFVGSSGAGKSTILNLLIGFGTPENGRILIDRRNLSNLDLNEYRSQIAVVPQNTILFSGSIRDNIAYGLPEAKDEEIEQVMREVGLDDLIESLPQGIHTQLGENGGNLSGGQRQRISIARALIRHPKIIIFDEATSALDSASEKKVQAATARMMEQATTFLVAHRLSTIKNASRIVVIRDGKAVESGSYEELMAQKGEFYHLKKLQD